MGHAWVSQQAVISDVFTSVTSVSLGAAAAKQGEHVIDIGCGTGDTLLAFAKAVGPSGAALGVDVSVPMLEFARHRAAEAGLANATCALADATTYAFEPRWANLVYSRFGVMFFDDPIKAFTNIRSGMKAGGRLVFVCFRTMPESPRGFACRSRRRGRMCRRSRRWIHWHRGCSHSRARSASAAS